MHEHCALLPQPSEKVMRRCSGDVAKALRVRDVAVSSVPVTATLRNPNSLMSVPSTTPASRHTTRKVLKMIATLVEDACHSSSCRENKMPKEGDSIGTTNWERKREREGVTISQ